MRRFYLLALLAVGWAAVLGGIIKAPKDTRLKLRRRPRSIDLTSAHMLMGENRLRDQVLPTAYKLEIQPSFEEGIFKGKVNVFIVFQRKSAMIVLHAARSIEFHVLKIWLLSGNATKTVLGTTKVSRDIKRPFYTIELTEELDVGSSAEIEIDYEGKLETATTDGIYKTHYVNSAGQESYIVSTQLRPNNARRLLPCFDEPAFKVPFELSVVRAKTMTVLANTPLIKSEAIPGEPNAVLDQFEKTPPISVYSLGFVISDLKELTNETLVTTSRNGQKMEIKIWSREDFSPALKGLGKKLGRAFDEISNFWRESLPMSKIDFVALPNYNGVRPVDAWGLIIFKESDLGAEGYFQVSQELIYQWLGNLVSPAWWTDAHLNKALVGYLSASTALKIDNGSEMDGKWPMTILYSLYYEFSKRYPHSRITGMKQETACSKIELIFRMFNYTLGSKTFKNGLQRFILEKKFSTFTGEDIWRSLTVAALDENKITKDISLAEVAESWITKNRLPVVNVERNYKSNTATISQKVYLRERPHDVPGQDKMLWWIPIVIIPQSNLSFSTFAPKVWMNKVKEITLIDMPPQDEFIIVNPEEIGPFPVNYDAQNWNSLACFLSTDSRLQIPVNTRAKLLHDAWNLAYAGDLSFGIALNMTLFLENERDHLVWDPVFTMIDHVGRHIDSSEVHKKFEGYVRLLLTPVYEELVYQRRDDEEQWKTNLRNLCKTFLCKAGYKPCIEKSQAAFMKWMDSEAPDEGNPVPNQYICPVFKWGSKAEWEFGLQRVINFPPSRKQSERTYLLKTLAGCPISKWKIEKLLNLTIIEENGNFTENDIYLIFSMLTGGSRGYTTLFNFLVENWNIIKSRFENKTNLWHSIISSATSVFTTQEGLDKVTKLFVERQGEFGSAEHIIEKSLKNIREETKWSDENLPVIEKWLDTYLTKSRKVEIGAKFIGYSGED